MEAENVSKAFETKGILRFVSHQKKRLLKNFLPNIIEILDAISISGLSRRWIIIWIQMTQFFLYKAFSVLYVITI